MIFLREEFGFYDNQIEYEGRTYRYIGDYRPGMLYVAESLYDWIIWDAMPDKTTVIVGRPKLAYTAEGNKLVAIESYQIASVFSDPVLKVLHLLGESASQSGACTEALLPFLECVKRGDVDSAMAIVAGYIYWVHGLEKFAHIIRPSTYRLRFGRNDGSISHTITDGDSIVSLLESQDGTIALRTDYGTVMCRVVERQGLLITNLSVVE